MTCLTATYCLEYIAGRTTPGYKTKTFAGGFVKLLLGRVDCDLISLTPILANFPRLEMIEVARCEGRNAKGKFGHC